MLKGIKKYIEQKIYHFFLSDYDKDKKDCEVALDRLTVVANRALVDIKARKNADRRLT